MQPRIFSTTHPSAQVIVLTDSRIGFSPSALYIDVVGERMVWLGATMVRVHERARSSSVTAVVTVPGVGEVRQTETEPRRQRVRGVPGFRGRASSRGGRVRVTNEGDRCLSAQPERLYGRAVSNPLPYLDRALEAEKLARLAYTEEEKRGHLDVAAIWRELAERKGAGEVEEAGRE